MKKTWYMFTKKYYSASNKREPAVCDNRESLQDTVLVKKVGRGRSLPHDSVSYMESKESNRHGERGGGCRGLRGGGGGSWGSPGFRSRQASKF